MTTTEQIEKPCWLERNSEKLIRRLQWHDRADCVRQVAAEYVADGYSRDVALAKALDYFGPSPYRQFISRGPGL